MDDVLHSLLRQTQPTAFCNIHINLVWNFMSNVSHAMQRFSFFLFFILGNDRKKIFGQEERSGVSTNNVSTESWGCFFECKVKQCFFIKTLYIVQMFAKKYLSLPKFRNTTDLLVTTFNGFPTIFCLSLVRWDIYFGFYHFKSTHPLTTSF